MGAALPVSPEAREEKEPSAVLRAVVAAAEVAVSVVAPGA
jgi:hypothetical protein